MTLPCARAFARLTTARPRAHPIDFRTELTDIADVVRGFVCFLEDGPTLTVRYSWRPYAV